MKQHFLILAFLLLCSSYGNAQFFDKYGVNAGICFTNQLWDYKFISFDHPYQDYKAGLSTFLSAEKKISKLFHIRPELGYIQKGFKNNVEVTNSDGSSLGALNKNVVFHDLAFNVGVKITPLDTKIAPYVLLGFRCDYMFSYKDIVLDAHDGGIKYDLFSSQIDQFNSFNLGGLIGIGLEYNDQVYVEIEYNPTITNSYSSATLVVRDNCMGVKAGINLNTLQQN